MDQRDTNRIKTTIIILLLILFTFIGVSCSTNTSKNTPHNQPAVNNSTSTTQVEPPKPATPPELKTEGVASRVYIKVLGMETMNIIEYKSTSEKPQGVFKVVHLRIKNNQQSAITVDCNSFKLLDDQKRIFSHSTSGGRAFERLNFFKNHVFFLDTVKPRRTIEGYVVFDVPTDAKGLILQASGGYTGRKILLKVE